MFKKKIRDYKRKNYYLIQLPKETELKTIVTDVNCPDWQAILLVSPKASIEAKICNKKESVR